MSTPAGQPDGPDDGYVGRHHASRPPPAYPPSDPVEPSTWTPQDSSRTTTTGRAEPIRRQESAPRAKRRGAGLAILAVVLAGLSVERSVPLAVIAGVVALVALWRSRGKWLAVTALGLSIFGVADRIGDVSVGDLDLDLSPDSWQGREAEDTAEGLEDPDPTPAPAQAALGEPNAAGRYPLEPGQTVPFMDFDGDALGEVTLEEVVTDLDCQGGEAEPDNGRFVGLRLRVDLDEDLAGRAGTEGAAIFPSDFSDPEDTATDLWGSSFSCLPSQGEPLPVTIEPGEERTGWLVLDVHDDTETLSWGVAFNWYALPYEIRLPG